MATMAGGPDAGGGGRVQQKRIMTQPINLIFRFLQQRTRVQVWLFGQTDLRMEGRIAGFDEYMNLVLDEAEEVYLPTRGKGSGGGAGAKPEAAEREEGAAAEEKKKAAAAAPVRRKALGRVLLKGDTITLMQPAPTAA
jgi:small nuclear ribonucleoprotein E